MTEQQLAAMRQALEALESFAPHNGVFWRNLHKDDAEIANAITALRTAIAEAESRASEQAETAQGQESRSDVEPVAWMDREGDVYKQEPPQNWCPPHTPLYTTPPAAQPAYDQTALELCDVCGWKTLIPGDVCLNCEHEAAAQRQWVGLTDEEMEKISVENGMATFLNDGEETHILWFDGDCFALLKAAEAKLKEKNGF